jgi:creatinine amidohydrolase/Fe(II)-dependent formamide hydrolase-like protein
MMRSAFGLLVLLALCLGAGASAEAAARTPYLEELTWTEVRDALASGTTTIILPVGGTEQSGPHMALGKHNVRVKALAGRIATVLGDTLVAPVVAYVPEGNISPPTEHMRFPGTISVPVAAYVRALREQGLSDAEIGSHAGVADTSLMLAVDPSLVRTDRLAEAHGAGSGVLGDARRSTAALGRLGVDLIVNDTVAAIRKARLEKR